MSKQVPLIIFITRSQFSCQRSNVICVFNTTGYLIVLLLDLSPILTQRSTW